MVRAFEIPCIEKKHLGLNNFMEDTHDQPIRLW